MFRQIIASTRFLILIAVVCIFLAATALTVYGAVDMFIIVQNVVTTRLDAKFGKQLVLDCIELVDLFLLATVMYITAIGLYELFVDNTLPLPAWLEIRTLDDLKNKLVSVVVVVLGVAFLGQVVSWDGQRDLLGFGASIALVIVALTYFLSQKAKGNTAAIDDGPTSASSKNHDK